MINADVLHLAESVADISESVGRFIRDELPPAASMLTSEARSFARVRIARDYLLAAESLLRQASEEV